MVVFLFISLSLSLWHFSHTSSQEPSNFRKRRWDSDKFKDNPQTIIHKLISDEVQYHKDLDVIEAVRFPTLRLAVGILPLTVFPQKQVFIQPLRNANPPVIPYSEIDGFMDDVFGNFYDVRRASSQLLKLLKARRRRRSPVIQRVRNIFLQVTTEFRLVYPPYVGHLPNAEKRLKEEAERNDEFRLFLEARALFS